MKRTRPRHYLAITLLIGLGIHAAEPTTIVLLAGAPSHGSGEHEFFAGCRLLATALNEQNDLPIRAHVLRGWPKDESLLRNAAAIIIYADGHKRHPLHKRPEALQPYLQRGTGIMAMHYATLVDDGPVGVALTQALGAFCESKSCVVAHWNAEVQPHPNHPVSNGVAAQRVHDEFYYNVRFPKPKRAVDLLTAIVRRDQIRLYHHFPKDGGTHFESSQTLMWCKERPTGGRGVGFTGGHWHRNWANDNYRKLVLNAIVWCAGLDVPENGVASSPITEEQLNQNLDRKRNRRQVRLPSERDFQFSPATPKPK